MRITVNKDYHIECNTYSNYRHWGHKAVLYHNYMPIYKTTITYYNRTWERYTFESILIKMAYLLDTNYKEIPLKDRIAFYNTIKASKVPYFE